MAEAVEVVKQRLEAEHTRKYEAAAKQIQLVQVAQLDRMRGQLIQEHEQHLERMREQLIQDHEQQLDRMRGQLIQEHEQQLDRLRDQLTQEHEQQLDRMRDQLTQEHAQEVAHLKQDLDKVRDRLTKEHAQEVATLKQELERLSDQLTEEYVREVAHQRQEQERFDSHEGQEKEVAGESPTKAGKCPEEITTADKEDVGAVGSRLCAERAEQLLDDLGRLEEEKARLQANQKMMKNLIIDLARHYTLRLESKHFF
jgi:hypothetical protein